MDWGDIAEGVAAGAPLLGSLLAGPAGAQMGRWVASALGAEPTPEAVDRAIRTDPESMVKLRRLEMEHERDLRRLDLEAETARLAEVNATMRAEAAANDAYVRRWRPTYGYVTAFAWLAEAGAICAAIVAAAFFYPGEADKILGGVSTLMGALTAMWGIALSVLGVNITKRSQDKQVAAGQQPRGLLQTLAERVRGGGDAA